jgi:phosphoesterase RecJ-like protein
MEVAPIISEIQGHLERAQRIGIAAHVSPDGDAIGSLLGLGWALRCRGKDPVLACPTAPLPPSLLFLPGSEDITDSLSGHFDVIVILDSSTLDRMDRMYTPAVFGDALLINIDHHVTNERYGNINWVDAHSASTAEMVFRLVEGLGVAPDARIATCLLAGIVTDTLGFRTSSTTARTLRVAAGLMDAGASLPAIVEEVYNAKPLGVARIWGEALQDVRAEEGLVWTSITTSMLERHQTNADEVKGLVSFLRGTCGTRIAALFIENGNGKIKVEFRSSAQADVAQLAAGLGGGGHKQASGCTVPGPLADAQARVLAQARRALTI